MGAMVIAGQTVLVTVDQVADGVHVDLASTSLPRVGRKAMTRNLSDVAAMAARPCGAVAAACLPRDFGEVRTTQLFDAMRKTAADFDCPLIGGDISMWDGKLLLTVTVFAEPAGIEPVLRKGAQQGDAIYVTGSLGGSIETVGDYLHHTDFTPRITLARTLAGEQSTRPNCMIDLSDGLARDLAHLCDAAGLAAQIQLDRLPITGAARQLAAKTGKPAWQHAVGDGEDYELLFTLPAAAAVPAQLAGATLTRIGTMHPRDEQPAQIMYRDADGSMHTAAGLGWEHHT